MIAALARKDERIRQLQTPGAYPGGGRNAAVRLVGTEWIAFVDAGIQVPCEWLERLLKPVDRGEPVDAVLGGFEPVVNTRFERTVALAYVSPKQVLPSGLFWRGYCLPSSAVRTSMVRRLHGFPEGLRCGEDLNVYGPRQDYKGAYIAVMMKVLDCIDLEEGMRRLIEWRRADVDAVRARRELATSGVLGQ